MNLSASERATLNFYQWEYLGRGYYHFDFPVNIEPPYTPFFHKEYRDSPRYDDGKVPSLLSKLRTLLLGSERSEVHNVTEEDDLFVTKTNSIEYLPIRKGFSISFRQGEEISAFITNEFITMLGFTNDSISFEIICSNGAISVQMICSESDVERLNSHLHAYFPFAIIRELDNITIDFIDDRNLAIADLGMFEEFMRPISAAQNYSYDPLTSIVGTFEKLDQNETAVFQIIFKGLEAPWAKNIIRSVSDGMGGSFFSDSPEMLACAREKVASPLYACITRIATLGDSQSRSAYLLKDLTNSITGITTSQFNKLIPLSNKGYKYEEHYRNLQLRTSNRLGMILNSQELSTLIHYPNKTVVSQKLHPIKNRTKSLPSECIRQKYVLGINDHNGLAQEASISDETFGKHIVIGGSTGTGKTHLLKQLIQQDLELENTAFVIDAHGDLVQDILLTIPNDKKDRVVFINIADEEFSFGFNIFSASSDAEKTVLASDLASAFADTWISTGDRIQSVLQKTLSTLIYSTKEASLLDMKRFLLEEKFRNEFLSCLDDPVLLYYWHNEFPLVRRNELSPLMLRIDTFMQTRLLRNIFAQARGIDFSALVEGKKLVLFQLSVGLIGLENSKFLAKLLIAKINQIAFSRQSLGREQRHPIHLYIDEANHYANTSAVEQILSGARKYNLALVLVLQHLEQVHTNILNSILTNTATQVFFRQSEKDGKRIAPSFSFFETIDFMELDIGEALVRVNKRSNDFSLTTKPIENRIDKQEAQKTRDYIVANSRAKYAQTKEEIQKLLSALLPNSSNKKSTLIKENHEVKAEKEQPQIIEPVVVTPQADINSPLEEQKQVYLEQSSEHEEIRLHRGLQNLVRTMATQRDFIAKIEQETKDGGRVDVELLKDEVRIGVEIAITNSLDYEVQNIQKCIDNNYTNICVISESEIHLKNIAKRANETLSKELLKKIKYITPDKVTEYLDSFDKKSKPNTKRVRGYRVKTNRVDIEATKASDKGKALRDILLKTISNKKKK